jgi:site-specific recombinase XerD
VLGGLAQARMLFPFPLLGIDTDSGSEFLNEEMIAYCEREQLTFTRGRPGVKNDQCHVEQKNGAVVREAVGRARLVGVQAYHQLREVYRALRLVVNCFQPSLKLLAKVPKGEQVRLVYDVAQTPVQRLLASGVLSQSRQRELSKRIEQIDPLALSEQLDVLRHALLRGTHTTAADGKGEFVLPLLLFSLLACPSGPLPVSEEGPAQAGHGEGSVSRDEIVNWPRPTHNPFASVWEKILALVQTHPEWKSTQILQEIGRQTPECVVSAPIETLMHGDGTIRPLLRANWQDPWPAELIQRDHPEPLPKEPHLLEETVSAAGQRPAQTQPMHVPAPGTSSSSTGEHEAGHLALTTLEQAMAAYVQEMRACGRNPKTLQWHQTSLGALGRYLWRQFPHTDVCSLTGESLRTWLTDLSIAPSARTGATRTVNTVAAYARSARAFCNWLVRQGYVSETLFPKDALPKAQRGLPQPLEPEAFVHLLRVCELAGSPGGQNAGMKVRNRAILWLLLDTGLQVSELCRLRLADVDRASATVMVRGKRGRPRTFPLSADGQRAVCAYLDQARLTPAWEPAVPEAQDRLLLTEWLHPLTRNSLTLLFKRLSQRAGFTRTPICASMLRDTYAIRFLQAGGGLAALREQLGVAGVASVNRYQHFCEQRQEEQEAQVCPEESMSTRQSQRGKL